MLSTDRWVVLTYGFTSMHEDNTIMFIKQILKRINMKFDI